MGLGWVGGRGGGNKLDVNNLANNKNSLEVPLAAPFHKILCI